ESSSARTKPHPYPRLTTGADGTPGSRLASPASSWLTGTPCPTRRVTALAARAKRRATPPLTPAEAALGNERASLLPTNERDVRSRASRVGGRRAWCHT